MDFEDPGSRNAVELGMLENQAHSGADIPWIGFYRAPFSNRCLNFHFNRLGAVGGMTGDAHMRVAILGQPIMMMFGFDYHRRALSKIIKENAIAPRRHLGQIDPMARFRSEHKVESGTLVWTKTRMP